MSKEIYNPLDINPVNPENINKINSDRAEIDTETVEVEEIISPRHFVDRAVMRSRNISEPTQYFFDWSAGVRRLSGRMLLGATILATGVANIGEEKRAGSDNEKLINDKNISRALETTDIETIAHQAQEAVSRIVDFDFMQRFLIKDVDGNETFNPGAFVIPFSVAITGDCKAKTEIEIRVPYDFARTFKEIEAKNPEARDEMVEKLVQFITSEAQNQIVIRGIAGYTDTALVYDSAKNVAYAGKPAIDLGKMDINNIVFTGKASAEVGEDVASGINQGVASLKGENLENQKLAQDRLEDMRPLLNEALKKAGVKEEVLANIQESSVEANLVDSQIKDLAKIAQDVMGLSVDGDEKDAYGLIKELNNANPDILAKINDNPEYVEIIQKHITGERTVNINFSAEVEFKKVDVFNIALPLPLLLLLVPGLRAVRGAQRTIIVKDYEKVEVPAVKQLRSEERIVDAKRRLFSEKTPTRLDEERSFHEVYDGVNLSERAQDTHTLLQHMLLEEVGPSLNDLTKEPLINYLEIVDKSIGFMYSNTREDGIEKGSYSTSEDAQRKITEELLEMWEKHDAKTYPMKGIDMQTVLNYRDSEQVVYWAKMLAYEFVNIAQKASSREDFIDLLEKGIQEAFETRTSQNGRDRNIFVISSDEGK
jgi:hypothetical protein